jgi:UDP-2,3-diacylglucosamine pyrophosphatase LpxH
MTLRSGNKYKTIFISDVHLGTHGCQAEALLDFLKQNTCDSLYLVGDIIDGWRLKKRIYWPQSHSDVIRRVLTVARNGNRVYYILGNHDEALRKWLNFDLRFGRVRILNRQDHIAVNGKRYLVVHGDMFDGLMQKDLKWIMHVGDIAYNLLIWLNIKLNAVRGWFGMDYWSLSKYLKSKTKEAVSFVDGFEEKLASYADQKGYAGVICGHIHCAAIKNINGIEYLNTGDWVESCTAIVETYDGEFKLIDWSANINRN